MSSFAFVAKLFLYWFVFLSGFDGLSLACIQFSPLQSNQLLSPQNFLRCQNNKNNYNLVCETLQFLDCICGSTTGGLGLLGLYINEKNVALINQTLESLTEYCQGPCHENQVHNETAPEGDCTSTLSVSFLNVFLFTPELHCDTRVQWNRYNNRSDPERHQPTWEEADGPGVGAQGEFV